MTAMITRSFLNKSSGEAPKKTHKSEREKRKRNQVNDLFLELSHVIEPVRQNNGKACILSDATRVLQDLLRETERLRKEHAALLSESHYLTVEKNELNDENQALEAEVARLQNQLQVRSSTKEQTSHVSDDPVRGQSTLNPTPPSIITGPLLVIPLHNEIQRQFEQQNGLSDSSSIKKPQPRYPTPLDKWPAELLEKQPRMNEQAQVNYNINTQEK